MLLQPLPQRRRLGDLLTLAQVRFNIGRWLWRRRAKQILQNPFAPHHRGRPRGGGRHRQHAAVPEQSAAWVRGIECDLPEMAAANVRDAVVPGEALVDERVVRVEQLNERAVLANDRVEQQLGLAAQRSPQVGVEARRFGLDGGQVAKIQPLAGEVLDERVALLSAIIRLTWRCSVAGSRSRFFAARSSSSSSGMLLHRKNESREASSVSLMR
jgi:hypothetical protein